MSDPADQRLFIVEPEVFDAFAALLDRPAVIKPRVAELLREPSPFTPPTTPHADDRNEES